MARSQLAPDRSPITLPSDQDASGRSFGDEELEAVRAVLERGVLTSTKGSAVAGLENAFAGLLDVRHAVATSSGTAAVHAAVAAIDPEPGDEVVVSPITDMGAIAPLLYQGAIPVFADVEPGTANLTAATIAERLSERTRAVVVTHLFGNPCALEPIADLCRHAGIALVEDCAQAYLARSRGRLVGTVGAIGCFSLQQGKHISCGEGGLVVTNDDVLARRLRLFVNKGWPYGEDHPDHEFLAPNYRLSELQGAVARAQLDRLEDGVCRRIEAADELTRRLVDTPGLGTPPVAPGDVHTYWRYALHLDPDVIDGGPSAVGAELASLGIPSAPRYIRTPAFQTRLFREQATFGSSRWPFSIARPQALDYRPEGFPGAFRALDRLLVLPWTERHTVGHADLLATAIRGVVHPGAS